MSTVNRISGMASGLDTDTLIKSVVKAASVPVDKLGQQKQFLQWKRDDYRTINSKVLEFRNASFDMKLQSSYLTKKVSSSQESAVTATPTASTIAGNYTLTVTRAAKAASIVTGNLPGDANSTATPKLMSALGLTSSGKINVKGAAGNADVVVNPTDKLTDVVTLINNQSSTTGVKAMYDSTLDRLFFASTSTSSTAMELNFTSDDTSSTDQLWTMLNLDSAIGTDGLAPTQTGSNTANKIVMSGLTAQVNFNGLDAEYDSNNFSIAGLKITVKSATTTPATVSVTEDIDTIYNKVKSFVDSYNTLIDTINTKTTEVRDRDFLPLTADQRASMSQDDIKNWETKAKLGTLQRDSVLNNGLVAFRQTFSNPITGISTAFNGMSSIGIGTSNVKGSLVTGSYKDRGKIYIDETKLRSAIANNPDEVYKLFASDDGNSKTTAGDGLAVRLYNAADTLFNNIISKAGSSSSFSTNNAIAKEISSIDTRVGQLNTRISDLETRYYKQFTAMEKYMSKMKSQSSYFSSQTQ